MASQETAPAASLWQVTRRFAGDRGAGELLRALIAAHGR